LSRVAPQLRALVGALIVFVAVNAAVTPVLNARYELGFVQGRVSPQFAAYDPLSVDEMLAAADRVGGRQVFWLGDSVVHARTFPGGDSPLLLEIELQRRYGPDIHVFNAAMPAARTGDKFAVLLRVLERRPALVIVEFKYLEFSRAQVESIPFRYPYLNRVVATDPGYASRYREFDRHATPPLVPPTAPAEVAFARAVDQFVALARFRTLLQHVAFAGPLFARLGGAPPEPTLPVRRRLPTTITPPPPPLDADPRDPNNFRGAYASGPFDAFPNAGLFFAERSFTAIERAGVPAIAYLASINHQLVDSVVDRALFNSNVALIQQIVQRHHVTFSDYNALLAGDYEHFLDTEHLTSAGHLATVRRILADHDGLIRAALGS
jgi:hypothetical protein